MPAAFGTRSEVIAKIKEVVPTANFSDPSWGLIDGGNWSVEVNIGDDEVCNGFALHVRGGDEAVGAIAAILQRIDLRAVVPGTDEFLVAGPKAIASFARWRAYRDRVVGHDDG